MSMRLRMGGTQILDSPELLPRDPVLDQLSGVIPRAMTRG